MTKQELANEKAKLIKEMEEIGGDDITDEDREEVMRMTEAEFLAGRKNADAIGLSLIKSIVRNLLCIKKADFVKVWMRTAGVSQATAYRQIDRMISETEFMTESSSGQLEINLEKLGLTQEEITAFWKGES